MKEAQPRSDHRRAGKALRKRAWWMLLAALFAIASVLPQEAAGQQRWVGEAPKISSIRVVPVEVDARDICVLHAGAPVPHEHVMPRLTVEEEHQTAPTASFTVDYDGFDGEEGQAAQEAFQRAVDIWATHVASDVPIRVQAVFADTLGEDVLGSARPNNLWIVEFDEGPWAGEQTIYPDAIVDALDGQDVAPGEPDIFAFFSSEAPWYYGAGEPGGRQLDFTSVVLHELGHGLGFFGSMSVAGGAGVWPYTESNPDIPVIYDRFTQDGSGIALIDTSVYPNPSAALAEALEGQEGGVFFDGEQARIGNTSSDPDALDARPELYAPAQWQQGSSYSHLDEDTYPAQDVNALMSPQIGVREVIQSPGAIVCGMFADMGWPLGPDCLTLLNVDLIDFAVRPLPEEEAAEVTWVIAGGSDVTSVEVQRRDFGEEYMTVQEVPVEEGSLCERGPGGRLSCELRLMDLRPGAYTFRLRLIKSEGPDVFSIEEETFVEPEIVALSAPYPNPFQAQATIEIVVETPQEVDVDIYNVLGQLVQTVWVAEDVVEEARIFIDGNGLAPGAYFIRIRGRDFAETQKVIVAR